MVWRPSEANTAVSELVPPREYVDQVVSGGRRSVGSVYQVDLDEAWGGRKRNCLGASVSKVMDMAVVEDVGGSKGGISAVEAKLAEG